VAEGDDVRGLAALDRRVVPALQHGARRLAHRVAAPLRALTRWEERSAGGRPFRVADRNRTLIGLLAALVVLGAGAVHMQRFPELRAAQEQAGVQTVERPGRAAGSPDGPDGPVTVGPPRGVDLPAYLEARSPLVAELDPAAGERLAVVSFTEFRTAEEVEALLAEVGATALVAQVRIPDDTAVPLQTEVVGGLAASVERALEPELAELAEEERSARELLDSGTIEDEAFLADLENRVATLSTVRNVVASGAPLLFAVAVQATPSRLLALAGDPTVRLVDVGPAGADPATARLFGILPTDTDRTTFGG
jgi:hypothetical protein